MTAQDRRIDRLLQWAMARSRAHHESVYQRRERDAEARDLMDQYHALLDRYTVATPPDSFKVNARVVATVVREHRDDPDEFRAFWWQSLQAEQSPEGRAILRRLAEIDARLAKDDAP